MKAFLTVVSICFSLIVAGESLMCEECVNFNGTNCSCNLTTCDDNSTSCENGIMEITQDGYTKSMAFKTCARFPECHSYFFSLSVGDFYLQMQKDCCATDNCNADPIVLPPRNDTPNGVICPVCYAENTTTCEPEETLNCTGLETKCMNFSGTVQKFDQILTVASRSCITKEPCEGNWFSLPDGPVLESIHFSCDDGDDDNNDD